MITLTEFENVKKVLFGNQKQSSITNDAITTIVLKYLKSVHHVHIETSTDAVKCIKEELQELMKNGTLTTDAEYFIRLVTGDNGYNSLLSGEPLTLRDEQPSLDSPKHTFRIQILGVDEAATPSESIDSVLLSKLPNETKDSGSADIVNELQKMAEDACQEIMPQVPQVVSRYVDNKYAQALLTLTLQLKNKE